MPERRRKYTAEFKTEAAKMVVETQRPIAEVAREISIILSSGVDQWVDLCGCVDDSVANVAAQGWCSLVGWHGLLSKSDRLCRPMEWGQRAGGELRWSPRACASCRRRRAFSSASRRLRL